MLGVLVETLIIRRFFARAPPGAHRRHDRHRAAARRRRAVPAPGLRRPVVRHPARRRPSSADFEIGGTNFNANDVLTMIVVPVCLLAAGAVPAALDDGRRHRRRPPSGPTGPSRSASRSSACTPWCGWSPRCSRSWPCSCGPAPWACRSARCCRPTFLVQALAAAVFGRFERFTTIAAAAIGLGIVDQAMTFQDGNRPAYNDAVLFVIVLAGLLLTRRSRHRAGSTPTPRPPGRPPGRSGPIPRELRRLPEVRAGAGRCCGVVLGAFVLTLPAVAVDQPLSLPRSSCSSASWPPRWWCSPAGPAR